MCKTSFVRHRCNHFSPPRLETCPTKIRFGTCKKAARIEVKGAKLCSRCKDWLPSDQHQQPAPSTSPHVGAVRPQPTTSKKAKRANDWMNEANKSNRSVNPSEFKTQTSPTPKALARPAKAMTVKTDRETLTKASERKAKETEARTRDAGKKRDFQIPLDEPSSKPAIKKQKSHPKPQTTHTTDFSSVEAHSKTALPPSALTLTARPVVRKSRNKSAPKRLDLQNSNTPFKLWKVTQPNSNQNTSPKSDINVDSMTINSLSKLNRVLESKLRSLGYSPTLLHSTLFSPDEIARLARYMYMGPQTSRYSPRLTPEARAEAFLNRLGCPIVRSAEKESTVQTLISPKGAYGSQETLDLEELDKFERAMMESESSPRLESVGRDGLFESSESEEE